MEETSGRPTHTPLFKINLQGGNLPKAITLKRVVSSFWETSPRQREAAGLIRQHSTRKPSLKSGPLYDSQLKRRLFLRLCRQRDDGRQTPRRPADLVGVVLR